MKSYKCLRWINQIGDSRQLEVWHLSETAPSKMGMKIILFEIRGNMKI
jgi:hypothetical protein